MTELTTKINPEDDATRRPTPTHWQGHVSHLRVYVFRVTPAVDDDDEEGVGDEDADGEEEHDECPEEVADADLRQEVLLVRTGAVLQRRRHKDGALVVHLSLHPPNRYLVSPSIAEKTVSDTPSPLLVYRATNFDTSQTSLAS